MYLIKDGGELIVKLYNQLSYARVLIGSHLRSIEGQTYDDVIIKTFFNSLLYKTNRF